MARRTFHCERMKEANFFQFAVFMTYVILPIALPIPDIVETSMCYNNTQCPAGYHMAVAKISTNCPSREIYCAPCKEGTFTEAFNTLRQCFPHRPCTFNAKILRPGTRTKDTTCQCIGHTYLSVSGDCVPWRKCGIGEGVLIPGNSTHNVHCEECPSGTFSVTEDWSTECQLHTRCEEYGRKTVRKGSRIRDTTCDADPDNESRTIGISVPFNEVVFQHDLVEKSLLTYIPK
ncbi:tumor necrosis factor receptor superfamily member 11B-like isoform X2 [Ptychodera flava]|uniref:tumor necrosis factor receptor superfamily member 11B-like isoform X2 n=1 Tax=Ptychodera flava TaxID=63121 RepID=UPI00396A7EB2